MRLSTALAAIGALSSVANALPKITRTGKYLYDESGGRFYIRGVAYQPQGQLAESSETNDANGGFPEPESYIDPLSSAQNCTRDLPYLKQLGVNAVRVYSVDPNENHDECMKTFDDNGIYVLLDVSLPLNGSINRASPSWSTNLLDAYINTIDKFRGYNNVLAFNIGNEVITTAGNTNAAPYVKAAARDVKAYLQSVGSSALVGYSATDGMADFRDDLAHYLTCGNSSVAVDLYGLNTYQWCGNATYANSGWPAIVDGFDDIAVPTYMSEYGCIFSPPRLWTETAALFSSPVADVFSGGVAFSYFPTQDGYGMVTFSGDGGQTVTVSDDFTRYAAQLTDVSPPNSPPQSSANTTNGICPPESESLIASTSLPPTPNEAACNCINENAFVCRVTPATARKPVVVGALLDYACQLLGGAGGSCDAIGGNGTTGEYGDLSFCSPAIKLSYVFSAYYGLNPVDTSCDFAGNATLTTGNGRPNTVSDASAAAASCLAAAPSDGVFTPTASGGPSSTGAPSASGSGTQPSGSSAAGGNPSGAASALTATSPLALGSVLVAGLGMLGGALILGF